MKSFTTASPRAEVHHSSRKTLVGELREDFYGQVIRIGSNE